MCDSKNWLHDPSVILSSFAQYDVSYLGKTYARGVGDRRDAERARQGQYFLLLFCYFREVHPCRGPTVSNASVIK